MRHSRRTAPIVLLATAATVAALSACSSSTKTTTSANTAGHSGPPVTAATSADAQPSGSTSPLADLIAASMKGVPASTATVPDGTYRVAITRAELTAAHESDLSNAGTWTFKVTAGHYTLACSPAANPANDCGNANAPSYPAIVELGPLRGSGSTMWIVHDVVATAAALHCDPTLGAASGGCGPMDPYHLTWAAAGSGLRFTEETVGGQHTIAANWWLKPYTKIA